MSVGNESDALRDERTGSRQDSSVSAVPIMLFKNVPRRARNSHPILAQENVTNPVTLPVM